MRTQNRSSVGIKRVLTGILLLASFCAFGLQKPLATPKMEPQTHTVYIRRFRFVPGTLTVNAGDTIVWKNEDKVSHTATSEGKVFDSGNIPHGASWQYVADKRGTYPYICTPHPTMRAKLVVQ